ncbi:MAG: amidohydrolase family protein [Acidimicrobiia bacterium]
MSEAGAIDVHAHCVPEELVLLMRSQGPEIGIELDESGALIEGRVRTLPLREDLTDPVTRLEHMDRAGVELQLLSSFIDLTAYALNPERGITWARHVNEALAHEAAKDSDRFMALATVPLQAPDAAAEELRYATKELGMVGVEIGTNVDGTDLITADLGVFWGEAARLSSFVLLHPVSPLPGIDLSAHFLHNSVGRPAESTIAISRLIFSGLFDRHPNLSVCVVHGGGFLPYQVGRLQRSFDAVPAAAARDLETPPSEVIRSLYFDTVLHSPQSLRFLIEVVGADRLLLGSDFPFEMGDPDPVRTLENVPDLTRDELEAIRSGNAHRLISAATTAAA